jgi:outer membrane lipoprotein-sorting protein
VKKKPTDLQKEDREVDPAAKAILDRLEASGKKYTVVRSDVEYTEVNRTTGEKESRTGWVAYQKEMSKEPAKFRVFFNTLRLEDGPRRKEKVDYIYDGAFLTIDKYKIKSRTRYQVEIAEALRIGKGPFPMPFGQKTADMVEFFETAMRPTQKEDPPGSDYLKLTPRKDHQKDTALTRVEIWVDQKMNLPIQVRTRDQNRSIKTVVFRKIQTQDEANPKLFDKPKPAGFELFVETLD